MFAVMKHYDLMLGIDRHICWPLPSPKPIGPKSYFTIMILHGIQPLTPMMAPTCLTLAGMTMQRGTDIGPGIPHIGIPSRLTPIDILFSSSISYFGPSTYHAEAMPVAAALVSVININANCWNNGPIPSGIVICPTTHFTGMTPMDILFGFVSYGIDFAFELATDKLANALGPVLKKKVIGPISDKLTAKVSSKAAAKQTAGSSASAAAKPGAGKPAPGKSPAGSTPQMGSHRPAATPPGRPVTPVAPSGPRPPGAPQIGAHRPRPQGWRPAQSSGPRPSGGPSLGAQRPQPQPQQQGWRPARPTRPPAHVWKPGKPNPGQRPPGGPTIGAHRPQPGHKGPSMWQIYKDLGYDALLEILLSVPMSIPHMMVMEMLPLTGIEEFGAPPEDRES